MSAAILKIMNGIILVFLSLFILFGSWVAFEVAHDCRAHRFSITRSHTDANAVTTVLFEGKILWQKVPPFGAVEEFTMSEEGHGSVQIETQFSNGNKRSGEYGYFSSHDPWTHMLEIGKSEDKGDLGPRNYFRAVRDGLSCLRPLRRIKYSLGWN